MNNSESSLNLTQNSKSSKFSSKDTKLKGSKLSKNGKDEDEEQQKLKEEKEKEQKMKQRMQMPLLMEDDKPISEMELLYAPYWNPDVGDYDKKLAEERLEARLDIPEEEKELFT
jgi:hypothetical protein